MNGKQLHNMLLVYPVTICTADQLKIRGGRFVISNTDTSQSPKKAAAGLGYFLVALLCLWYASLKILYDRMLFYKHFILSVSRLNYKK